MRELARALQKGVVYLGVKPVYWCPTLQTALAEAEVEYHNHKSPSIFVKFPFEEANLKFGPFKKPVSIVIWTTTPWTLPANLGVAVHPDFEYGFFETESDTLLIAKELKEFVEKEIGTSLTAVGKTLKGSELERMNAQHPFYPRKSLLVLGQHVSLDAGTGAVHTAPGHGQDDYKVGLKYGLEILSPIDGAGRYTDEVPEYKGIQIFEANPMVVERLKEANRLLAFKTVEHSYPHNWRSKTPLIFRATPQWFLGMDMEHFNVRKMALAAVETTQFVPAWGAARLRAMVENRPDWCLSRQRTWGVPIPVFFCEKCNHPYANAEVMFKVADLMEKEGGLEAYHKYSSADFIGNHKCEKCGHHEFAKGQDILDVWFDSGVCHAAVQSRRKGLKFPADIYLEGSDQHRGWFQTSLLSALASRGEAPFKTLLTHGFVTDTKGRKMSKSLGNVVVPAEVTQKSGAEILRIWAAYEDYGQDIGCGTESFARVTETYRRFRNTMRFLLGNISDFDPNKDRVSFKDMPVLDRYALATLNNVVRKCTHAFDSYEFYKVYHILNTFFTVDLSAGYLDMLKDRLYTANKNSLERKSAQTVLYDLVKTLIALMAPITSFLSEETLEYIPGEKPESVFLMPFPEPVAQWDDEELLKEFALLFEVRSDVSKKLEELRREKLIGTGLDAKVIVTAQNDRLALLKKYEFLLSEFFIVSQVALQNGDYTIAAERAAGGKCLRCWYYSTEVGKHPQHVHCCPKCVKALT